MRRRVSTFVIGICTVMFIASSLAMAADKAPAKGPFKVIRKFALDGGGRWDYLVVDNDSHRMFMSRATHVAVLDPESGATVGDIPNTPGVHGIALAPELGVGFVSAGGESKVSVFDLKTLEVLSKIDT